ncbi:MAG: recombinase RecA [Clostridiales bacterium]|nr:recombinase RecA [Clostridiales bacterium]
MAKKSTTVQPAAPAEDKQKALATCVAQIERTYGKGSIMRMGDKADIKVESLPTGSLTLDLALGIGGLPRGRIVEIYGPESSGKTTLALHCVAEAQKAGGEVAYIDAEHAMDPAYARALGVDIDSMLISQPDTGEQGLEICEQLVRSGALDVVVVDSVAALVPRAEIEGEMGDSFVGIQARLMSQALRKLAGSISKTNCIVIFINQLREKVGVMYGNPEVTTGGRALKFYASVRIDVRRVQSIKVGDEIIGNHTRAKVVKNKVAPPFREAEFDIMYGEGISKVGELVDLGVQLGLVEKSGSWFSMGDLRLGQGRDAAKQYFKDHPDEADKLEAEIRANSYKLMSKQSLAAAKAAGRPLGPDAAEEGEGEEAPAPAPAKKAAKAARGSKAEPAAPATQEDIEASLFSELEAEIDLSAGDFDG